MKKIPSMQFAAWLVALSLIAMGLGLMTGSLGWEWGVFWSDPIVQDLSLIHISEPTRPY